VIKEEPALDDVPERVRPLLRRCLRKDPRERLRDIGDAWALLAETDAGPRGARAGGRDRWVWPAIAAVLAIGWGVSLWAPWRTGPAVSDPVRFTVDAPVIGPINNFAVSPDGRKIVMQVLSSAGLRLWVRSLDSLEARELPDTESVGAPPFWSFDSRFVAFLSADRKLKKVDVNGGVPQTICEVGDAIIIGGSWNADGVILFPSASGLMRVSASGGQPSAVVESVENEQGFFAFPTFLPDGRRFTYFRSDGRLGGIFRGSLDAPPARQNPTPLVTGVGNPMSGSIATSYVAGAGSTAGRLLFFRGPTVMAQSIDDSTLALLGEAVPVADEVRFFWAARDALVYASAAAEVTQLTWFDEGKPGETVGEPGLFTFIALSPDARRAAAVKRGESGQDLWLVDLLSGRSERLTFSGRIANVAPVWSRDSKDIFFSDFGSGVDTIYRKAISGATEPELVFKSTDSGYVTSQSADGRFLLHMIRDRQQPNRDIGLVSLDGSVDARRTMRLIATPADETDARFSPDGRWIAYKSDETGRTEVYVKAFSPGSTGQPPQTGARFPVSKSGVLSFGGGPFWRADSRAVAYFSGDGVMVAEMTGDPASPFGEPKMLLKGLAAGDISPDGRRLLMNVPVGRSHAALNVVLHWQSTLQP
jgi:Tol biopolymer transport system component